MNPSNQDEPKCPMCGRPPVLTLDRRVDEWHHPTNCEPAADGGGEKLDCANHEPVNQVKPENRTRTWAAGQQPKVLAEQPAQQHDRVRELECVIADLKAECQALRAEQPAQQCWKCGDMDAAGQAKCTVPACGMKEQPSKPLTDEQIDYIYNEHCGDGGPTAMCQQFARAIEAAHGIQKGEE